MKKCAWCDLTEEERKWLLLESEHWSAYLADEQDYIGRCILISRRHCGSIAELTPEEWTELKRVMDELEHCCKEVLSADLCNWSCLMNNFYKKKEADPHIHFHLRPRCRQPIVINGNSYADEEFGHHYALKKESEIKDEDRAVLYQWMKDYLSR